MTPSPRLPDAARIQSPSCAQCAAVRSDPAPCLYCGAATEPAAPTEDGRLRGPIVALAATIVLTMLPVTMIVPVLKELVTTRHGASTFDTHLFMSINMIGALLIAPLIGLLSDRCGRRRVLIAVALVLDALLLWALGHAESLEMLFLYRTLEGMSHMAALTLLMSLASDWAPAARRGRVMGVIGGCIMFGTTVGSVLGGRIGLGAAHHVFLWGGEFALIGAVVVLAGVRDAPDRTASPSIANAVRMLARQQALIVPYAYAFIDRFCVGIIISTFMLYLGDVVQLDSMGRGWLMAAFTLPFALLCYPVGRLVDRIGVTWPLAGGSLLFGGVMASYGLVGAAWLPALMVASGILSAVMFAPNLTLCAALAQPGQRGTAFAGFNVAGSLGFLCGPLVGGALCAVLLPGLGPAAGYATVLVVAGATEIACAALTLPWLLGRRNVCGTARNASGPRAVA